MDENRDEEWIRKGVDIWMIRENLKLSFTERVAQHQDTLNFIDHLQKIKVKNHARPSVPPQNTGS
ncbi:MAG: hypothetical protein IPJ69_08640 [Deltaproteobacteria bacterium]|nr:MAG: hypothetical protein IPJ69_08640 [Deltaproteobacteria bacterium]